MLKGRMIVLSIGVLVLSGCVSNPLNRATSERYSETCAIAEQNGKLGVAEEACYRALVNTDWGNLGKELKSEKLYNLARIKRRLAKFQEAEVLLRQSLEIEEARSEVINEKIGRRLVELSVNLIALKHWEEGSVLITKVVPIAERYSSAEREFIVMVLREYSKHFKQIGEKEKAHAFDGMVASLQ